MDPVPAVGDVVWQALRHAPARTRRDLALVGLAWAATLLLQYFDIRGRHGPRVWAEIASVLLFTAGTLMLAVMHALRSACEPRELKTMSTMSASTTPILLALPAMGLLSGAMLAAAATVLVVRYFLGSSAIVLVLAVANLGVLAAVARAASSATRVLYGSAVEQAAAAARAEGEAAQARLAALQAQMNPHFLFNALNTVASLVRTDPRSAETTVENLSEVLRRTLERTSATMGTLADEVDYIKAYLAVEEQRFGDRLAVEWAIAPELLGAPVPPMTLQPLVENAIKHGIGPRRAGGRVRVTAAGGGDRLRLAVEDDGDGFGGRAQEGTGLGNLRKRLAALYGEAAALRIESPGAGARVVVEVPLHHARADR